MTTYKVTRFYRDRDTRELIDTGLTLAEAQAHCDDPESSSSTAKSVEGRYRTQLFGPWFDGYTEEG